MINDYLKSVKTLYKGGKATEHSYRGDLQKLIENLVPGIKATNEPKRIKCGAPDYIIERKKIPVGYIEAKDIGVDLNTAEKTDQLKRYKKSLDNLILTDYLEFRFFKYGKEVKTIKIAEIDRGKIIPVSDNFDSFMTHITDFCSFNGQTIKSAEKLAKMMAQKARMMEEVIFKAVTSEDSDNTLKEQLEAFQKILIHDLTEKDFADIYAQTISYGLFAARLHDETLEDFSREEALFLVPKTNPFLRNLFSYIAGPDLDQRITWIVNDLADIFRATDINALLSDFGSVTRQTDPFIHFYETFLAEYDPKLRKSRGVYYTPEPVVTFIVRAVDDILKKEFNLPQGLADTSKIDIKTEEPGHNKKVKKKIHKVQILDPATGTGTFLAEIVKQIYKKFENQKGIWSSYVENELLPRLNGFEILMAPYTMCHLKLEVLLKQTGYKPKDENKQQRLRVFLTNSLEEAHPYSGTLFASWLSKEATEANTVKKETPVMIVLGNPPYSISSTNRGKWILGLIKDYKKDLNEKKINIDDDYIKFIRYGQFFIEKNGEGILAFISNNSFIDGITHRRMRNSLLKSFNKIYILDLHGNSRKKETCPDGAVDQNVFDIMAGVSINLFIRNKKAKNSKLGKINHYNLYGIRRKKYEFLLENSISKIKWKKLENKSPYYYFVYKNLKQEKVYKEGFKLDDLMQTNSNGVETQKDNVNIFFDDNTRIDVLRNFQKLSIEEIKNKYRIKEGRDWKIVTAKEDLNSNEIFTTRLQYRPFDFRYANYTGKTKGIMAYPRFEVMRHLIDQNIGIIFKRGFEEINANPIFISKFIIDRRCWTRSGMQGAESIAPLYIYSGKGSLINMKIPNFDLNIIDKLANHINVEFTHKKEDKKNTFAPIDILDYIYAVLHSPSYREKYKEFLKIDFPRVPYPEDKRTFWKLVKMGGELRQIHLLESQVVEKHITSYPVVSDNIISKVKFDGDKKGKVWINEIQYFDNVPKVSWEFYIGGYQPAQKWLKDRKGRELSTEDVLHYQKIIVALSETDRIMKEIDKAWKF